MNILARLLTKLVLLVALMTAPLASALDQVVTDFGDNGGQEQLRAKINACQSSGGGTITFSGSGTILLGSTLPNISGTVTIDGGNAVVLSGNNATRVLLVDAAGKLTLQNLTIRDAHWTIGDGGALRNNGGMVTIDNCKFLNNSTTANWSGGAIMTTGPMTITNTEFGTNKGGGGGALYPRFGNAIVTVTNCNFHDNEGIHQSGGGNGGAILLWDGANVVVSNSAFTTNKVPLGDSAGAVAGIGGAIYVTPNSKLTVNAGSFTGNAAASGGAIFAAPAAGSTVAVSNAAFTDNTAVADGGAIFVQTANFAVSGCSFLTNKASGNGGGIYVAQNATLSVAASSIFDGNTAVFTGGAIANFGNMMTLNNVTCNNNSARTGGAIRNTGPATISLCSFTNNKAGSESGSGTGGGLTHTKGKLSLTDVSFDANASKGDNAFAGAIYVSGDSTVTADLVRVTISNNSSRTGGGIALSGDCVVNLVNSTVSNNSATYGGGITCQPNNPKLTLVNVTMVGNSATAGAGLEGNFLTSSINVVLARGASGPNCNFSGFSANSLSDDGTCGFGAARSNINPLLGPLADNGGFTKTHMPSINPRSPVIDTGTSDNAPTNDQRGVPRPQGVAYDVGAVEVQPSDNPSPTPTASPTATPTATPITTLANISTRLRVETGDNVLIGGFIVTGTQPKKVIIRAIGTSLPFSDKLQNPTLELHGPNGLIEANDNWVDSPNYQAIIDSTIPPSSNLESAIVAILPANNAGYTAIVRGANDGTGIGVVEAYDLDTAADSKLANISTRGLVQTGDNVLIAGTIVVGQVPQRVIIRAVGPSLPIVGKMENPTLELRDSSGTLLQANDNWIDSADKQAIIDSTIPPTNNLESAIIALLPANNASYTAIVRGVNDTTGIAVVEVYALP